MPAPKALDTLTFSPKRAAKLIEKVLRSAMANAGAGADAADMKVKSVRIDGGPVQVGTKRFIEVSRGMAHPIRKRTSHITVVVEHTASEE
jgi:large subunit ribosomal protein L22